MRVLCPGRIGGFYGGRETREPEEKTPLEQRENQQQTQPT